MIEEGRRRRLEAFRDELVDAGYEVVAVEPQLRESVVMRLAGEEDDTVGFVVVRTPVEIGGVEFEGDLVVVVFEDRIAGHGVDVRSTPEDLLSEEEREHLSTFVPPREVDEADETGWGGDGRAASETDADGESDSSGESTLVWTYYPPPAELPDAVVGADRDNVDDVVEELSTVFDRVWF